MPSAFISHSSQNDRYVTELEQFVRGLGYGELFNDGHSIAPDEDFWKRITQSIRACDTFVVVLSHDSVASEWVDREVQLARDEGKRVVPIRIDDCHLPASFEGRDVVELRPGHGDRPKIAPSRILRHSPDRLFGREEELAELDAAWEARERLNVYTLIAWGGAGKTSLVAHWVAERFVERGWPGVERYFDWSFYSQGSNETSQAGADFFIDAVLEGQANELDHALSGLREAGTIHYVPAALLTASLFAWLRDEAVHENPALADEMPDSLKQPAEEYLADAEQIAVRGPMPLYLADVHLHRARLFRDKDELAKARALIDKHKYGRRRAELEDAEAAAAGW